MAEVEGIDLPFKEAVDHFRQKVNLPTQRWTDVMEGAHARAFVVAGAAKEDLLKDFRGVIDKAISKGTTIEEFRRDFDQIVQAHGWNYKGGRGWRTRVIYSTNITTAYAAGRYQQMTDPDVLRLQPYWEYRHSENVKEPREEHLAWDGLVLKADDPWWKTHYPPNGWGCHCYVEPVTRRELQAKGKKAPDQAPPVAMEKRTINTASGPAEIDVPKGIDPGWGYNVGDAAFGRRLPEAQMSAWRQQGASAYERLTPGDWQSAGRPEKMPVDKTEAKLGPKVSDVPSLQKAIQRAIGGEQKLLTLPDGEPVLVDAAALASHINMSRAPLVPFLPEVIQDPFEVWLAFERHKGTGQVLLRKRILKLVPTKRGHLMLVAQAAGGVMEAWTFLEADSIGYFQRQRVGKLLWGRD